MLSENEMLLIAEKYVKNIEEEINVELMVNNDFTIKKSYGNIYYYHAKDYKKHRLAGNGPFLVRNDTGIVIQFGTAMDIDYYIEGYENGTWEPSEDGVWDPN